MTVFAKNIINAKKLISTATMIRVTAENFGEVQARKGYGEF